MKLELTIPLDHTVVEQYDSSQIKSIEHHEDEGVKVFFKEGEGPSDHQWVDSIRRIEE